MYNIVVAREREIFGYRGRGEKETTQSALFFWCGKIIVVQKGVRLFVFRLRYRSRVNVPYFCEEGRQFLVFELEREAHLRVEVAERS